MFVGACMFVHLEMYFPESRPCTRLCKCFTASRWCAPRGGSPSNRDGEPIYPETRKAVTLLLTNTGSSYLTLTAVLINLLHL